MAVTDDTDQPEPAPAIDHFTAEERVARGRSARAECPRSSQRRLRARARP